MANAKTVNLSGSAEDKKQADAEIAAMTANVAEPTVAQLSAQLAALTAQFNSVDPKVGVAQVETPKVKPGTVKLGNGTVLTNN